MVIRINTLRDLPYKRFHGYILDNEKDTEFVGDRKAYLFICEFPKCICLFIELDESQL
jgi:hypothetical protein